MDWSAQQDKALSAVARWIGEPGGPQVFRLFGYAGTGKTTLARHVAENVDGEVQFAAFTGKAALVLREKGCGEARTIHSLIYRPKDLDSEEPSFVLNEDSPASRASLIVIDECSMVDEELGRDLLSFGKKVLVLGDPAQLPPVKGGGFFTEQAPDVMLTEVHRQAADNPIVRLSMLVRAGERLAPGDHGAMRVIPREKIDAEQVKAADQVLVGLNKTRRAYNRRLRELFGFKEILPEVGEKLVCLRNDKAKGLLNGAHFPGRAGFRHQAGALSHGPDAGGGAGEQANPRRRAARFFQRRGGDDFLRPAPRVGRIRLWLRPHRAQGAGLAMGQGGAVRRELGFSRKSRTLALYRRHPRARRI